MTSLFFKDLSDVIIGKKVIKINCKTIGCELCWALEGSGPN